MKNFGFHRLVLADLGPVHWPDVQKTAVQSSEIVEHATRAPSLEAALEGCSWTVGTTMRHRPGQRHLDPTTVAKIATTRAIHEDIALIFGEARVGLTNQDLLHCHDISVIPTHRALRSLNLAQAVLIYLWELHQTSVTPSLPPSPPRAIESDYARLAEGLRTHMMRIGFRDPDRSQNGVLDLIQTLKRAGLTPHEARLWEAVFRKQKNLPPNRRGDP